MGYKLKRIMIRPNGVEKQVRPQFKPTRVLSNATVGQTYDTSTDTGKTASTEGSWISDDGHWLIFMSMNGSSQEVLYRKYLTTPFDLTSINSSYNQNKVLLNSKVKNGASLCMNRNGTQIYIADYERQSVEELTMSTPRDLSTLTKTTEYPVGWGITGVCFSYDGSYLYCSKDNNNIYQYSVSIPRDLSSTITQITYKTAPSSVVRGVVMSRDGEHILGGINNNLFEMDLVGANDMSSFTSQTKSETATEWNVGGCLSIDYKYFYFTDGRYVKRLDMPGN